MVKGILEVKLIDAKGLKDTDFFGKIDPYAVVHYKSQERKSRIARGQGRNPTWNETIKFQVHSGVVDSHHQHKLTIRLMDHDRFSADDFIGEATIHVGDVIALGMENGVWELKPTKYRVVLGDRSYCGEIRVGVIFTMMKEPEAGATEEIGG